MCLDQLELNPQVHVSWHGHGLNTQINNKDKNSSELSSI